MKIETAAAEKDGEIEKSELEQSVIPAEATDEPLELAGEKLKDE